MSSTAYAQIRTNSAPALSFRTGLRLLTFWAMLFALSDIDINLPPSGRVTSYMVLSTVLLLLCVSR